jgi:hypothetical protein
VKPRTPAEQVVVLHLREWPNVALDAALDLANEHGPTALLLAITEEFCRRHSHLSVHPNTP